MRRLIVGCGYLGARVAQLWQDAGDEVHVVTRSAVRAAEFNDRGLIAHHADVTGGNSIAPLPLCETVVFSVGYERGSSLLIEEVYPQGLANTLAALPVDTGRLVYISSTGVYGPADTGMVNEATVPSPRRAGGRASLAAEQILADHFLGERSLVLRLAGIYGPGRVPYLAALRAGEPLAVPSDGWLNLIHVDDAAAVVVAADHFGATHGIRRGPEVFCVTDGHPVVRRSYYCEVARLIGTAEPTFAPANNSSPAALRSRSSKRIDNSKMRRLLHVSLKYPTYHEGLAMILSG